MRRAPSLSRSAIASAVALAQPCEAARASHWAGSSWEVTSVGSRCDQRRAEPLGAPRLAQVVQQQHPGLAAPALAASRPPSPCRAPAPWPPRRAGARPAPAPCPGRPTRWPRTRRGRAAPRRPTPPPPCAPCPRTGRNAGGRSCPGTAPRAPCSRRRRGCGRAPGRPRPSSSRPGPCREGRPPPHRSTGRPPPRLTPSAHQSRSPLVRGNQVFPSADTAGALRRHLPQRPGPGTSSHHAQSAHLLTPPTASPFPAPPPSWRRAPPFSCPASRPRGS